MEMRNQQHQKEIPIEPNIAPIHKREGARDTTKAKMCSPKNQTHQCTPHAPSYLTPKEEQVELLEDTLSLTPKHTKITNIRIWNNKTTKKCMHHTWQKQG
jgi:hypothetical protein